MKELQYFFPHDANAGNDPKIVLLIKKRGYEGYGWYWRIVEILRQHPEYKVPISEMKTFSYLQIVLDAEIGKLKEFLQDCYDLELFEVDDNFMWSVSLQKRMEKYDDKRLQGERANNKRWHGKYLTNKELNPDGLPMKSERTPIREDKIREEKSTTAVKKPKKVGDSAPSKDVTELRNRFYSLYQSHKGTPYAPAYSKDGGICKKLIKSLGKDEVERRMVNFFNSNDQFIQNAGYTFGVFHSQINKLDNSAEVRYML